MLEKLFLKKRSLSYDCVAAFVKIVIEIVEFTFKVDDKFSYCLLIWAKLCLQRYGKLNGMLDEDNEGYGFDAYNFNCQDPYAANALKSTIFDSVNVMLLGSEEVSSGNSGEKLYVVNIKAICQKILTRTPWALGWSPIGPVGSS
jgi:hypothetical protein